MNGIAIPKPIKRERKAKKYLPKTKTTSVAKAKIKAWVAFSKWVRISAADEFGMARCVSCGVKKHYKDLQAGHFIPGRNNAVLFSEDGCHPQCYGCNIGKGGNWPGYFEYMRKMYGIEYIEQLIAESRMPIKYTLEDYIELAKHYTELAEEA
jgi:5-methylcytosine-specific restriction endonuclease McrA